MNIYSACIFVVKVKGKVNSHIYEASGAFGIIYNRELMKMEFNSVCGGN